MHSAGVNPETYEVMQGELRNAEKEITRLRNENVALRNQIKSLQCGIHVTTGRAWVNVIEELR